MEFKITFKEKHAIALQEKKINKIAILLKQYYPDANMSISALLKNEDRVWFNDIEELLAYDNSNDYRIDTLYIDTDSRGNYEIKFHSTASVIFAYDSTVSVSFYMENKDDCIAFKAKLKEIFKEMRLPFYYTFLSKFSATSTFILVMTLYWFYNFMQPRITESPSVSLSMFAFIILFIVFGVAFISGVGHIWSTLFLPIYFLWGDDIIRLEKIAKTRSNIFWAVIVGVILIVFSRYIG